MTTVKELAQHIGQYGYLRVQGMQVAVEVVDARVSFGGVHLEITPASGSGTTWVDRDSVMLISVDEEAK